MARNEKPASALVLVDNFILGLAALVIAVLVGAFIFTAFTL